MLAVSRSLAEVDYYKFVAKENGAEWRFSRCALTFAPAFGRFFGEACAAFLAKPLTAELALRLLL